MVGGVVECRGSFWEVRFVDIIKSWATLKINTVAERNMTVVAENLVI